MRKRLVVLFTLLSLCLVGCQSNTKPVKVGVSLGVGKALRWAEEKKVMEQTAKDLSIDVEVRINDVDGDVTQVEDCKELIDSGIQVLVVTIRNAQHTPEIVEYAKQHNVKVIAYSRPILNAPIDLYIGFDCVQIGREMGTYLSELAYTGDYIVLKGDPDDFNTPLIYDGAMGVLDGIKDDIRILADEYAVGWSADEAKRIVREALAENNNHVDAILSPNDNLAKAAREELDALNVTNPVAISGMDADIAALQRIASGKQSCTVYLHTNELATISIEAAKAMAQKKEFKANDTINQDDGTKANAYLLAGELVTKENLDHIFIDSNIYTREEIYQ